MNRAKLKGALVLSGVFALGGLAGGAAAYGWAKQEVAEALAAGPNKRFHRRHLRALERRLDLTAEQREQIHAIMERYAAEREKLAGEMREKCGPLIQAHKEKVDAEIRGVLTPDQQEQFDKLQAKQRERFPMMGRRLPRGPGDGRGKGRHGDRRGSSRF